MILNILLKLLAREVAKSHIVEGPQYNIYQKRHEFSCMEDELSFQ